MLIATNDRHRAEAKSGEQGPDRNNNYHDVRKGDDQVNSDLDREVMTTICRSVVIMTTARIMLLLIRLLIIMMNMINEKEIF